MLLPSPPIRWRLSVKVERAHSQVHRSFQVFRLHVKSLPLGNLSIARVRPMHLRPWVKDRSEVLAPSTLTVVWGNVNSLFSAAVADRIIGISPCTGVTLPEVPHHKHYIPEDEQVHQLAENMPGRYSAVAYLGAGTGFRGGEIMGLEVDAIDFDASEIDVTQQLVCVAGQKPYLGPPKTRTSVRTVKAATIAMAALERHLEDYPPVEVEIWDRTDPDKRKHHVRTARLVFTSGWGRPLQRSSWAHVWVPASSGYSSPSGTPRQPSR